MFRYKQTYYLEPGFLLDEWIIRKEGSGVILKKSKHKNILLCCSEDILKNQKAELRICDSNGLLEEIINF